MDGFKLDQEGYIAVVKQTIRDLKGIMDVSVKDRAKDLVKSAMGRSVRTKDPLFWPAGMLMLGLVEARRAIFERHDSIPGAQELIDDIDAVILKHITLWKNKHGSKVEYIDDALAGAALVKLYQQSYDEGLRTACKDAADKIYTFLLTSPRDEKGTIVYNADRSAGNVFSDGVGMVGMFLAIYGDVFEKKESLELAKVQLSNFRKYGMDERTGLPYHGYAIKDGALEKKGVLSWGRAAGWLIMGLSEYALVTEEKKEFTDWDEDSEPEVEQTDSLAKWFMELSEIFLSYQRTEGGYGWQIQALQGHLDTSATGMVVYGLLNGLRETDRLETVQALNSSFAAIESARQEGKILEALSSCDDFGVHYQVYGSYPWGQGAALAALTFLLI